MPSSRPGPCSQFAELQAAFAPGSCLDILLWWSCLLRTLSPASHPSHLCPATGRGAVLLNGLNLCVLSAAVHPSPALCPPFCRFPARSPGCPLLLACSLGSVYPRRDLIRFLVGLSRAFLYCGLSHRRRRAFPVYYGKLGGDARRKTGPERELRDSGGEEHKFSWAKWGPTDLREAVVLEEPLGI